jgi:SAM-dependent methyltransferase
LADIGCGRQPYRSEFKGISEYTGIDRENADIVHDLATFPYPLPSGTADWILCTQVIDDFPDQPAFVRELHRMLAQGGSLILSVSFVWELHDLPHDYGRPSPEQLRLLLEGNGFEIVDLRPLGNSWVTLGQVLNINLLNIIERRSWWLKLISPFLLLNSLFFYAVGSLFNSQRFDNLPLAFFLVARKKQGTKFGICSDPG